MAKTKVCSKCKKELSLDKFRKESKRKDGIFPWCNLCSNKYAREWKSKNKEKVHGYNIKHLYGISGVDYSNLLKKQSDKCAICGKEKSAQKRNFDVDHNHKTKRVRGLLCYGCNVKLGWYERHQEIIIKYLKGE